MEDNIKKIREACIAANPSIKDLDVGCQIKHALVTTTIVKMIENHPFHCSFYCMSYYRDGVAPLPLYDVRKEEIEIIGRPIRLADVLLAMRGMGIDDTAVTIGGHIYRLSEPNNGVPNLEKKNVHWNLLKDNLEEQSPETLSFIAELLSSN